MSIAFIVFLISRAEEEKAENIRIEEERRREEEGVPKIDLTAKMQPFTNERKRLVLDFFMKHFLEMARKSNEFRNEGQAYLYTQMCRIISKSPVNPSLQFNQSIIH